MLRLAVDNQLDLVRTARTLAMAHVSGGTIAVTFTDQGPVVASER
jgi:hypothetical protein